MRTLVLAPATPMLIRCPHCTSDYEIPADLLFGGGRKVRCADCRECWLAEGPNDNVLSLFGPEIVAEARWECDPATARPPRPHPRARLAGSLRRARGAAAVAMLGAMAVLAMAGIARKEDVVRFAPKSAALFAALGLPVNLRGLALDHVESQITDAAPGQMPVLTLEGRIANLRTGATIVPELRFSVRDKAQNELYSWTAVPPKPRLGAGETIAFRSRLAAPPPEGHDLVVSFADAADTTHAASKPAGLAR